ncbi:MAG: stage III sporulation protein AF [Eubacterium sp.]|nr:stage III sporulation protein AF [Eubacterium sp.]
MADYFRSWIKMVLYLDILLCILSILLERSGFEKYVRLFTGFLMLFCLILPLIRLAGMQDIFDAAYLRSSISCELRSLEENQMDRGKDRLIQEYENMIMGQIKTMGQSAGLDIHNTRLELSESDGRIRDLYLTIHADHSPEEETKIDSFRNDLSVLYQLEPEHIFVENT